MEMLTGNGKPTRNTKGLEGQTYKDLDTGDIYECEMSSEFSTLHHAPIGGYLWKLKADGNGDDIIKDNALHEQVSTLSKEMENIKNPISFFFSMQTFGYACSHTFEQIASMSVPDVFGAYFYDTQNVVSGETTFNYMRPIYVRKSRIKDTGVEYFEFTFLNHNRDGYMLVKLDSNNTVTKT